MEKDKQMCMVQAIFQKKKSPIKNAVIKFLSVKFGLLKMLFKKLSFIIPKKYNATTNKIIAIIIFLIIPVSPIIFTKKLVTTPIIQIVINIPKEKISDIKKDFFIVTFLLLTKPITSGILERWQGLYIILNMPQINAENNAKKCFVLKTLLRL